MLYIARRALSSISKMMMETACSPRNGLQTENHVRDTSVFDFVEADSNPFQDKNTTKAFFQSRFAPRARKTVKRRSVSVITGKLKRTAKSKNTTQQWQRNATKSPCQRDAAAQEALSDEIETDSDSVSERKVQRSLHSKTGGVLRTSSLSMGTCSDKEPVAEKVTEVIVTSEALLLLNNFCISSACFTFTVDAIVLTRSNDHSDHYIIEWPLSEINSFGSYPSEQAGCALLELSLTESGAERLKKKLQKSDACDKDDKNDLLSSACVCLQAKICDVTWTEKERRITSLSDHYKSLWRPLKVKLKAEQVSKGFQSSMAREILKTDDCDRPETRLHGWIDIVYPKGDQDAVTVTKNDFELLNPGEFISDTIIDFYIKHLQSTLSEHNKKRLYFFNSFFYRKLTEIDKGLLDGSEKWKSSFEGVKRWTTKVNIFEKDYLFIPIMQSAHWSLIIICHPGYILADCEERRTSNVPVILHFDSLKGSHTGLEEPIQKYLMEAWIQKYGVCEGYNSNRFSDVKFISAQVPQQTNYSDCGLFLLHYVEAFIKDIQNGGLTDFVTSEWFNPKDASNKRLDIQNLLIGIHEKELAERGVALKTVQDMLSLNVNNGMVYTNGTVAVLEGAGMRNRDLTCVSKDFERKNMVHDHFAEQKSGAIMGPLLHETQLCNGILDSYDHVEQHDSTVDTDLCTSQGFAEAFPQDSSGSCKKLLIPHHSHATKDFIDHAIVEEDSKTLKSVSVHALFEDVNPHSLNASLHGNTQSVHVCHVSNLQDDPVHKAAGFPNEFCSIDVLRCGNNGMQDNSKQMVTREMCSGSAADKIVQSPVCSRQLGSAIEYGSKNISFYMSGVEELSDSVETIFDIGKETTKPRTFQETDVQDSSGSMSNCSPLREVACPNRAVFYNLKDKIWVERDSEEVSVHNEVNICQEADPEGIISIHRNPCRLEDKHLCPDSPERMYAISVSSDEECCSPVYQPGLDSEVENMIKAVKLREQTRPRKIIDDAVRRPVTRSVTNRIEDKLHQQRKRKSVIEVI